MSTKNRTFAKTGSGQNIGNVEKETFLQVEYVTGNVSTLWGGKRAAAGRTTPFELEGLGIGNENCKDGPLGEQVMKRIVCAIAY